jgi:hypothetical protein
VPKQIEGLSNHANGLILFFTRPLKYFNLKFDDIDFDAYTEISFRYKSLKGVGMRIRTIVIAAIFFTQSLYGIIFDALKLSRIQKNGTKQTVWLLGDCHEYSDDLTRQQGSIIKKITHQQRADIVAMAQHLKATVLVEDIANCVPAHPIIGLPTMITLAMDKFFANYHEQVITNLATLCRVHAVPSYSIECRHAALIADAPPTYLSYIMDFTTSWIPAIIETVASGIFFGSSISFSLGAKQLAHSIFYDYSASLRNHQLAALYVHQYLENKAILTTAQQLHQHPAIKKVLRKLENALLKKPCVAFDRLVDFKALNFIVQHPACDTIMLCAGAWHTDNIADLLVLCGFEESTVQFQYARKKPCTINGEHDVVVPLAIRDTVAQQDHSLT